MALEINVDVFFSESKIFKKMKFNPETSVTPSVGEYVHVFVPVIIPRFQYPLHCNRIILVKTSIDFLNSLVFFVEVKYRCSLYCKSCFSCACSTSPTYVYII